MTEARSFIEAARRIVCANSRDSGEARELMLMLGLYPDQKIDDEPILWPNELPGRSIT